jgi:hypothetical protein
MKFASMLLACLIFAAPAFAHGPTTGPHGGAVADAGDYHVELVAKGTALTIYLRTEADKDLPSAGHKAVAILLVAGKAHRIELAPGGGNKLTGMSPAALPANPKGAVQISLPGGKTIQATFE